jgi:hypothetical protein
MCPQFERRVELMHTPYSLDVANRPHLINFNDALPTLTIGYNKLFNLTWSGPSSAVNVTGVALVAPSSDTHSYNSNQRVVFLQIVSRNDASKRLLVRTPTQRGAAPPQVYMLFLLNRKTYSTGYWFRLT